MKTTFTLSLILLVVVATAQTRRIAHRFHSGSNTARYDNRDGNYGDPYIPPTITIHLESGRDTTVYEWDSLAAPYYKRYDTVPRAQFHPYDKSRTDIREMGGISHKLIVKGKP